MLFYLDEQISFRVRQALSAAEIDVITASYVGMLGKSDREQLIYATQLGRVLVTHDRDFVELHRLDHGHAGIIYAWDFKITQLKLIEEIININKADESMHGRLITLGIDL
jgi:predicted nuclease of predicted toxin-antitoxin system